MRNSVVRSFVIVGLAVLLLSGQSTGQPVKAIGLKAGLTNTNQSWSSSFGDVDREWQVGFDVGAFAEWLDHPWFGLNTELHFVRKGSGLPAMPITTTQFPDGTGEFVRISCLFDYVSASVLSRVHASLGAVEIYALAGPRMDVLVHRAADIEAPEPFRSTIRQAYDQHFRHYRDVDFGGDFALGCHVSGVLLSGIGAEVRYSPDFAAAYDISGTTMTNRSWEFLLVVSF
jgi:hypothetical protein